ncbi:MAG: hypothetical protein ACREMY_09935, partial [bacterium]
MASGFVSTTVYHRIYDPAGSPVTADLVRVVVAVRPGGTGQNYIGTGWYPPSWVTWPDNPEVGVFGGTIVPAGFIVQAFGAAHCTENTDGTGAGYDLGVEGDGGTHETVGPGAGENGDYFPSTITFRVDNPTDRTLYLQSLQVTGWRAYQIVTVVGTPPSPPGTPPPPTNLPPEAIERIILEKLNPGFTGRLTRELDLRFLHDLVTVDLGQRVNVTMEAEGQRIGFHNRGHLL